MLNFREELKKIKEGKRISPTIDKYADTFLNGLLNTLIEQNVNSTVTSLFFKVNGESIYVKLFGNNITNLYTEINKKAKEIFSVIKEKLKSENFLIDSESDTEFVIYLD